MKCEGIQGIRRLTKHHPEVLVSQLHSVTLAIIAEVRGLFQTFLFICFLFDWSCTVIFHCIVVTLTKSIGMKKLFKYGLNFQRLKIFDHKFLVRASAVLETCTPFLERTWIMWVNLSLLRSLFFFTNRGRMFHNCMRLCLLLLLYRNWKSLLKSYWLKLVNRVDLLEKTWKKPWQPWFLVWPQPV